MGLAGERGYLLLSANASGTGRGPTGVDGIGPPLQNSGFGYSVGMMYWLHTAITSSANSAAIGVTIYATPDPLGMPWLPISSLIGSGAAGSGSAMLTANYGYLQAGVNWVSGIGTGRMTMFVQWSNR